MYPTGSCLGKFYGTGKVHKLPVNGGINELPIRPAVSNLNIATFNLAKYLSKLSLLRQPRNTVKNTKEFIEELTQQKLPKEHKKVSFEVKSLFTNVSLDHTIDIVLKRICERNEIATSIIQNAMGSPLGPVLQDIFMTELENSLLPNLFKYITFWKRYVDDTICFVKIGTTEFIISVLNSFEKYSIYV